MSRLLANEEPILTARQSWLVVVPALLGHAVVLIGGLIVLAVLHGRADDRINGFLPLLQLILVLGVVLSAAYRYVQWRALNYLLTDQRIVVSKGVINRLTTSVSLDRVQDTTVHQTLLERLVHCGDVEIESAGRDGTEIMHLIPDPQGFCNALLQAIEAHRQGRPYPGRTTDDGIGGGATPRGFEPVPPGQPRQYYGTGAAGAPSGYPGAPAPGGYPGAPAPGGYPSGPGYPAPGAPAGYPNGPRYPQPDYRTVPAYEQPGAPGGYPQPYPQYPQQPRPPIDPSRPGTDDRMGGQDGLPPHYRPRPNEG